MKMKTEPFALIMAGGIGSRFWPASRENLPKQFLDITGSGKSLIQTTFDRLASFIPVDNIYVITHQNYKGLTLNAISGFNHNNLILEPTRNNTAASIALASFKLYQKNKEAVCIVAPADHIIKDEKEFQRVVIQACEHAETTPGIVTLGIKTTRPDIGYGYIEFENEDQSAIRKIKSFREKPDLVSAMEYVKAGNFVWNSGIFIWRLDYILEAYKAHATGIYNLLSKEKEIYNTDLEADFIFTEYPKTEKISVDYAILEKDKHVFTIPCDIGWSDIGTWNSLYDVSDKISNHNAVLSTPVYLEDTKGSMILSENSKLVVIKGLEDFIVVDTHDCLMIFPKSDEQEIKALKEKLKDEGLGHYL
jgi:mannose-1-phosphate guanylyltransferase